MILRPFEFGIRNLVAKTERPVIRRESIDLAAGRGEPDAPPALHRRLLFEPKAAQLFFSPRGRVPQSALLVEHALECNREPFLHPSDSKGSPGSR